jgi:hypothetical protein
MPVGRVRESIDKLLSRNTHPYFVAYLYLRSLQGSASTLAPLNPDWTELSRLLEVSGAPPSKPHLRPFWKGERNAGQEWLNKNLAGSFAPSSLRNVPARVVTTDAQGRFILRKDHWELARKHLLFDVPLPALAVASFVFRDYGFMASSLPDRDALVEAFRREYGYADDNEFNRLYETEWSGKAGPWFHPIAEEIAS